MSLTCTAERFDWHLRESLSHRGLPLMSVICVQKPKTRMGSGRAHASRVLSYEEKWLHAHQRHLSLAADGWDVILFGDDLVEAWRCRIFDPFSGTCDIGFSASIS